MKPSKTKQKRLALQVEWKEREGWKPFGHRLNNMSSANRGFLTGVHQIEKKKES